MSPEKRNVNDLKEGQGAAYEQIKSKKSLEEILEVAMSFEKSAWEFYEDLIPKVSKKMRYIVEELAEEEKTHYEYFRALASNPDLEELIKTEIKTPVEDHKFSDYIHITDLGKTPSDQDILRYALCREDTAMKQYRELADSTEAGSIHDLFEFLANEETKHKCELEKLYYEIVHTGGPGCTGYG